MKRGADQLSTERRSKKTSRVLGRPLLVRLVQVAKYLFLILLSGLVGAYGGTLIDAVMGNTSGVGRHWGWILGAVVAAIGAPFGWVSFGSGENSRRSIFATPTVASLTSSKARKSAIGRGRGRPMGLFKAAGVGGLVGLLMGAALGGTLLMIWFSIAMSPFAPSAWNRSVTFKEERLANFHHEREPDRLSTKNRIPLALFLGSLVVLGAGGAITAAIFSLAGKATEEVDSSETANSQHESDIE